MRRVRPCPRSLIPQHETWSACQKQYLLDGWMHNNLRMYWAKRLIAMTPTPEAGWATAFYLNDRLSLDGRDPSTYGNLALAFGDAAPGYGRQPIFGLVSTRSDGAIRKRAGESWIRQPAERATLPVAMPDEPPVDLYSTDNVPSGLVGTEHGHGQAVPFGWANNRPADSCKRPPVGFTPFNPDPRRQERARDGSRRAARRAPHFGRVS